MIPAIHSPRLPSPNLSVEPNAPQSLSPLPRTLASASPLSKKCCSFEHIAEKVRNFFHSCLNWIRRLFTPNANRTHTNPPQPLGIPLAPPAQIEDPLLRAVRTSDIAAFRNLGTAARPTDPEALDLACRVDCIDACICDASEEMIRTLLQRNAPVNRDRVGRNLNAILGRGANQMVAGQPRDHSARVIARAQLLLDAHPNVNANSDGWTPLHHAVGDDRYRTIVQRLIAQGADLNALTPLSYGGVRPSGNPLHHAVVANAPQNVNILLAAGSDPNAVDQRERTALHYAYWFYPGNRTIIHSLLAAGAREDSLDARGERPHDHLPQNKWPNLLPPAPILAANVIPGENSALITAAQRLGDRSGVLVEINRLLEAGADIHATHREEGFTALHFACLSGSGPQDSAVVLSLIAAGANVNHAENPLRLAPLHNAVQFIGSSTQRIGILRALLAAGADPNARNSGGLTPLHYAYAHWNAPSTQEDLNAIRDTLIAAGADPQLLDNEGRRPNEQELWTAGSL